MPKPEQLYLDHLFPKDRPFIRLDDFAKIIGFKFGFAWKLWDEGILPGHNHHGRKEGFDTLQKTKKQGKDPDLKYRYTQTIPREAAIAYLIKTSNYDDELKLQRFLECLDAFNPEDLLKISQTALTKATTK